MITRKQLIDKYLKFFQSKGHKVIPSASLVPANDPTVLFTTAGMHPLVPFLLGQKHPLGKKIVNVQKVVRTGDIEEVGDTYHHTFFEMLGNWSLGDYFKEDAIKYSYEFLTSKNWLGLDKNQIAVSVFVGDKDAPKDTESEKIWLSLGVPKERIAFLPKENNWWGPAGNTGPCGPDTEMFYWASKNPVPKKFNPKDSNWREIWNNVFMQYNKTPDGKFVPLKQKNVDTGMGVERTLAALNGLEDNYESDVWKSIIKEIEDLSTLKYKDHNKRMRIVADHIKAAVFIIADGVRPSNKERGSILRTLIRKAIAQGRKLGLESFTYKIAEPVFETYEDYYPELKNKKEIFNVLIEEEEKFSNIIANSPRIFNEIVKDKKFLSGEDAFLLHQSYAIPREITEDIAREKGIKIPDDFGAKYHQAFANHVQLSGSGTFGTFKSGLADNSEKTTRLHTATHLLNEALRAILGPEVRQRGSNITPERLRFDFNFPRKLTDQEIKTIEDLVNEQISASEPVRKEEMSLKKALAMGAQAEFGAKYPEIVSVYFIGGFSKEICTGPHVKNTKDVGKFKIIKEESSAAGIRRIKAIVE